MSYYFYYLTSLALPALRFCETTVAAASFALLGSLAPAMLSRLRFVMALLACFALSFRVRLGHL